MKHETRENFGSTMKLTQQNLQKLKDKGFRYVQVQGFTHDKRLEYIEPHYFMLVPLKNLPDDPDKKGIYEPINSEILDTWASVPNDRVEVLIATKG